MIKKKAPQLLWQHFAKMSEIPRPSKKEEKIRAFYREYAKARGFDFAEDEIGNIVIRKPATKGYEDAPKVILQGHIDMVCQKRDSSSHDFEKDPLQLVVKGDWLYATDTTLGADNGVGVAAAIAILEDETAQHGPLEVLLTVDEEMGMGGVRNLQPGFIEGKYLINLDSETEGECTVGCAGGTDFVLSRELYFDRDERGNCYEVLLEGLKGGHSGLDIHKELGNANQLLAEVLADFSHHYALRLLSFKGGSLRNAIPRSARAVVAIHTPHDADFKAHIAQAEKALKHRLRKIDEEVTLTLQAVESGVSMDAELSQLLLNLLVLLPNGVLRQSVELPVVETSCNLGVVNIDQAGGLKIALLARSVAEGGLDLVRTRIKALSVMSDCFLEEGNDYPAWEPNLDSRPYHALLEAYREIVGEEMKVSVMHAGLETGLLGEIYPHLEMVSFGPTIEGAHSPDERVNIPSVERFYELLKALLVKLK